MKVLLVNLELAPNKRVMLYRNEDDNTIRVDCWTPTRGSLAFDPVEWKDDRRNLLLAILLIEEKCDLKLGTIDFTNLMNMVAALGE